MNRAPVIAAALVVLGLLTLGAGVAPSIDCERTYGVEVTERTDVDAETTGVVAVDALPADVGSATQTAIDTQEPASIGEPAYRTHLEDRLVRSENTTYATELVVTNACGGTLEDVLLVAGTALVTLGAVAVLFVALYAAPAPPLSTLHLAAAVLLVAGAGVFATGIAAPAGCTDNYALETTELADATATNERIVDASSLPPSLETTTTRSVTSNQTAFVNRTTYRTHLENASVRYDDRVYDADIILVQDCGSGLDDALLIVGLVLATLGATALSLLVLGDHGEKVL